MRKSKKESIQINNLNIRLLGGIGNQWFALIGGIYYADIFNKRLRINLKSIDSKHGDETILDALKKESVSFKIQRGVGNVISGKMLGRLRKLGLEEFFLTTQIVRDHSYLHEASATQQTFSSFRNKNNRRSIFKRTITLDSYLQDFFYYDELVRIKGYSWVSNLFRASDYITKKNKCAIHIRLGDFDSELRESFGVISEQYYLSAIYRVLSLNSRVTFDIYTDNIVRAKELYGNLGNINPDWIQPKAGVESRFVVESFLRFSRYDYKIIGNSTFGFASAKIGSPKAYVFYPSQMYKKAESRGIKSIPTDWRPIESDFF